MPHTVFGNYQGIDTAISLSAKIGNERDFKYEYPEGLNLKPGSELHTKILRKILSLANESKLVMSSRYDSWRSVDDTLQVYVELDTTEQEEQEKDPRKPFSMVIPVSYATLDTIMTYLVGAFFNNPIFRFEGQAPEDVIPAILLEKLVQLQCERGKADLALYTHYRDGLAYGFGAVGVRWDKRFYKRQVTKKTSGIFGLFKSEYRAVEEAVAFEGNVIENIDPFNYFPDPNYPVWEVQKGDFSGWLRKTSYLHLIEEESQPESGMFNAKYCKYASQDSTLASDARETNSDKLVSQTTAVNETSKLDEISMYVKVIPKDWGLGSSEKPEIWLFEVVGDTVVVRAQPLGLNHCMFPVAVCAPDFDGYSVAPLSRMELISGMQLLVDHLVKNHIANQRKAINDMFIVDPMIINMNDIKRPSEGKLIRLRPTYWGRGVDAVKGIEQLKVTDVTANNLQEAGFVTNFIQMVTGVTDAVHGIRRRTSERVTAAEVTGELTTALSKLERIARVISMQSMRDIAYFFASHTQQLMSESVYVKASGMWREKLEETFGGKDRMQVDSSLIYDVDYDIVPFDGQVPGGEASKVWVDLLGVVSKNPILAQKVDMLRLFTHVARMMGAKNIDDFILKVVPNEQAAAMAQSGQIAPIQEVRPEMMPPQVPEIPQIGG